MLYRIEPMKSMFQQIMFFYFILSFVIGPIFMYYIKAKTLRNAGDGYMIGSIISILLWLFVGRKMI